MTSGPSFFKTRFGGSIAERYNYVVCREPYTKLYKLFRKLKNLPV